MTNWASAAIDAADVGPCDDLSILCVTKNDDCVNELLADLAFGAYSLGAELILAADGRDAFTALCCSVLRTKWRVVPVQSRGYVESVLDDALRHTSRRYVLRIDDDEEISTAMYRWLESGIYRSASHWQFPRQHKWKTAHGYGVLMTPHLWPDYQTRLSVRSKAGGRNGVHAPSPYGGGEIAPVSIIHHKYLVRTLDDRRRIAQTYDAYSPGYGTGNMLPFSLPELAYDEMHVVEAGDGSVPWTPKWETVVDNRDHGF